MIVNPGSHRPQGPWDPDEKRKWLDTTYFWTLLPLLALMIGLLVLGAVFGTS